MAKFQRIEVVEARQYDGPKTVVVSDAKGEQTAVSGDWLIGSEPRKVTVLSDAEFKANYSAYSATPQDDQIAADKQALATLKAELAEAKAANDALTAHNSDLDTKYSAVSAQLQDQSVLQAKVKDLTDKLSASESQKAADEAKLAELTAQLQAFTDAQAKLDAAKAAVEKALS